MTIGDTFLDYPDKESHALIVYMTGCSFNCKGCHNPEMQEYTEPVESPVSLLSTLWEQSKKFDNTNKLVLSGGDPLYSGNIDYTRELLFLNNHMNTKFDICIYTGHDLQSVPKDLTGFSFIKLGCYQEELKQEQIKNDTFLQFASSNQVLIDHKYKKLSKGGTYYYV